MGVLHTSSACLWLLWILPRGGIPVSGHEEAAQKVTGKQNWHGEVPTLFITSLVVETKYSTEATQSRKAWFWLKVPGDIVIMMGMTWQ